MKGYGMKALAFAVLLMVASVATAQTGPTWTARNAMVNGWDAMQLAKDNATPSAVYMQISYGEAIMSCNNAEGFDNQEYIDFLAAKKRELDFLKSGYATDDARFWSSRPYGFKSYTQNYGLLYDGLGSTMYRECEVLKERAEQAFNECSMTQAFTLTINCCNEATAKFAALKADYAARATAYNTLLNSVNTVINSENYAYQQWQQSGGSGSGSSSGSN
jgi:hypothetical protein